MSALTSPGGMMPAETAAPEQDASVTTWAVLAFMLLVIVLMAITPAYRTAIVVGPIWLAVLLIAYEVKRRRQRATNSIESPTPERP